MGKEHQLIQRKLRWEKKSEIGNLRRRPADDFVSFFVLEHGFFLFSCVSCFVFSTLPLRQDADT